LFTNWFKIFACSPAARRTPEASYITIKANMKDIAKAVLPSPSVLATAAAKEDTVAECELGMPPAAKIFLTSRRFSRISKITTLAKEAKSHPSMEHTKT
jgi:hypothetical protein